ncbi:MAG: YnbE family lipoprotein [Magnetococcales bacterium]|nr:YnbE family lipoprotein [Magnetococcales bacterium]MBF0157530.1 YnbE family lipoprotein [Magnetococcales bacterium]
MVFATAFLAGGAVGCSPTVRVEVPREPIVINLNVKIEHDVRVRLEKDVEAMIKKDKHLF